MKGTTGWMENQIIIKMLPFRICGILLSTHTYIRPPRTLPIHDYSMQKQLPCWILLLNGQKLCVAIIQYMYFECITPYCFNIKPASLTLDWLLGSARAGQGRREGTAHEGTGNCIILIAAAQRSLFVMLEFI